MGFIYIAYILEVKSQTLVYILCNTFLMLTAANVLSGKGDKYVMIDELKHETLLFILLLSVGYLHACQLINHMHV